MAILDRNASIKKHYKDESMKIFLHVVKLVCFKDSPQNQEKTITQLFYDLNFIRVCHRAGNSLSDKELYEILYEGIHDRLIDARGFISVNFVELARSELSPDRQISTIKTIYKELCHDIYNNLYCSRINNLTIEKIAAFNKTKA